MFTEQLNFAVVQTELDSVFYQRFDELEPWPSLATARSGELFKPVETTHAAYIEDVYKGSGFFPKIGETTAVPLTTPKVTNKLTTLVNDFANGINISKNLFDDNMHGVWAETVRDFADKARLTQDFNQFGLLRGAFTTTLTADGAALITSSHTLIGGGTASNSVSGALDSDTLFTATKTLMEQKDQAGVIRGNTPALLVVPANKFKLAIELTDSALVADSAQNAINVYRSAMGITVLTSPYLGAAAGGSDTAWFLLARNHGLRRLIRQGIQTALRSWEYSDNRSYLYQANFRESAYAVDWAGIVGSTG